MHILKIVDISYTDQKWTVKWAKMVFFSLKMVKIFSGIPKDNKLTNNSLKWPRWAKMPKIDKYIVVILCILQITETPSGNTLNTNFQKSLISVKMAILIPQMVQIISGILLQQ